MISLFRPSCRSGHRKKGEKDSGERPELSSFSFNSFSTYTHTHTHPSKSANNRTGTMTIAFYDVRIVNGVPSGNIDNSDLLLERQPPTHQPTIDGVIFPRYNAFLMLCYVSAWCWGVVLMGFYFILSLLNFNLPCRVIPCGQPPRRLHHVNVNLELHPINYGPILVRQMSH